MITSWRCYREGQYVRQKWNALCCHPAEVTPLFNVQWITDIAISEVLSAVLVKIQIFCDTPCRLVNSYGCVYEAAGSEAVQNNFFEYSDPEDDAESKLLWNVGEYLPNDMRHTPQEIDQ
jgi:hypothetical protein